MDVEAKRTFKYGFVLREADLRRLIDIVVQQLDKVPGVSIEAPSFRMKFRNGVFANASTLDEVFAQENSGSRQIVRLKCEHKTNEASSPSHVLLEFINADEDDESGSVSLRYQVFGHDRDWVFVTSSLLEERFERMKRFALNQVGTRGWGRALYTLSVPVIVFGVLIATTLFQTGGNGNLPSQKLQAAVSNGQVKDVLSALVFLEQQRELKDRATELSVIKPFAVIMAAVAVLMLVWYFFYKYYPVYNFCWGEYIEEFRKRESARRFWLVVVAIGLVLSFIGSALANKIHW